ncbi:helix-turn-helix domain-containing protein [Streptosporangium roseum]|uniref:helix-turn-helix domain-containing protein n=1 Tax=Streptosporangium roseum TaxID=2001 RepID=UPI003319F3E5
MSQPDEQSVDDPFLTVAEVATQMRVSKMTVYRLVNSGKLAASRPTPRTIRIRQSAVKDLLAESPADVAQ